MPRILLVEDEPLNAEIVIRFLRNNHEVVQAVSGPEAVTLCSTERPDLILMDMALPHPGDGQQATKEIRGLPAMQTVPIIALTATCMPENVAEMFQAGCDDFMGKPVDKKELLAKIAALLARAVNK